MLRIYLFNVFLILVSLYAVFRGGMPERITGMALVLAGLATFSLQGAAPNLFYRVEFGVFLIDLLLFGVLLATAIHADRWWTLWVAAMQGLGTGAHLVKALNPDTMRVVYAILSAAWSYPIILLLLAGTIRHGRRVARTGADLDWSAHARPAAQPLLRGKDAY